MVFPHIWSLLDQNPTLVIKAPVLHPLGLWVSGSFGVLLGFEAPLGDDPLYTKFWPILLGSQRHG